MRKYFLAIAILSSYFSFACGNEYFRAEMPLEKGNINLKFLIDYDYTHDASALPYWTHGFTDGGIRVYPKSLLESYKETKDYKYLSDYAWELVKNGQTKEAIDTLESLLKTHPNEYNILANLGTAYEIVGNNTKALEVLTKAVSINKDSHYGSEWIHLNILKHKINNESFPIEKIIDLGIDVSNSQWNTATWNYKIPADSLLKSIAYQLHERIGFIAPKDKIIGRLVFDFAEIIAKTKSKEEALPFYDYAMYYDNELYSNITRSKQALPRVTTTTTVVETSTTTNTNLAYLILSILAVVIPSFFIGRYTAKKNATKQLNA
jgi:tetratricopeptide (TPR) repeat protein